MNILVLSPVPLYPCLSGLELRVFDLVKPLCERHNVSVLSFRTDNEPTDEQRKYLDQLFGFVETVARASGAGGVRPTAFSRLKEWFAPTEITWGTGPSCPLMRERLNSIIENGDFDLVFAVSAMVLNYVLDEQRLPVVFDAIDDPSLLYRRDIGNQKHPVGRLRAIKDWLVVRKVEKRLISRFKEIVITSEIDASVMRSLCPRSQITVIANGVDPDKFERNYARDPRPTLVFTGVMDYGPNVDGIVYFCGEILPRIAERVVDVQLLVVGRNPDPAVTSLAEKSDRVTVTGTVDDLSPYLGRAWVYVCPLISGAGIKNKILEAWSAGTPVVATSMSCEGIDVAPQVDILQADTPEQFADDVVRLISDRPLAERLVDAGRKKILSQYDWGSKAASLEEVFVRAVEGFVDRGPSREGDSS